MALQDLVASKDSLAEKWIDEAIKGLIHLDKDLGLVLFTPESTKLPDRQKVLVYLVALQAWRFVAPKVTAGAARHEIEEHTCLGSNEVRRALASLEKDRIVVRQNFGRYFLSDPAMPIAKTEIDATRKADGIK